MKDFLLFYLKGIAYACMRIIVCFIIQILILLPFALFSMMATSCRSVQTVVEYQERKTTDTLILVDSVYIDRWHNTIVKGDTIHKIDSVIEYRYKVIDHDIEVIVHDSIPYEVEVVREVTKNSKFARFCIFFFIALTATTVIYFAVKITKKFTIPK